MIGTGLDAFGLWSDFRLMLLGSERIADYQPRIINTAIIIAEPGFELILCNIIACKLNFSGGANVRAVNKMII